MLAHVIVDVPNVSSDIYEARRGWSGEAPLGEHGARPTPFGIHRLTGHLGFEPCSITFVGGGEPVPGSTGSARQEGMRSYLRKVAMDGGCEALPGFADAAGEVGVDGLVCAASLAAAGRVAAGDGDVVLVFSGDADVMIVHEYAPDVAVHYLTSGTVNAAVARACSVIRLDDASMLSLACEDIAPNEPESWSAAVAGDTSAERWSAVVGVPTLAIVDAYGLYLAGRDAVADAQLPTIASVRQLLSTWGFPTPAGVFAAIPDIPDEQLTGPEPGHLNGRLRRTALEGWDRQFATSRASFEDDGDPTTEVVAGILKARTLEEKQLATRLVADTYWALATLPDTQVVVFSDRWDLALLHERLALLDLEDRASNLTRVSVHTRGRAAGDEAPEESAVTETDDPFAELAALRAELRPTVNQVVLPEPHLVTLLGSQPGTGRAMRSRVASAATAVSEEGPVDWTVVGYDPERDVAVARHPTTGIRALVQDLGDVRDDGQRLHVRVDALSVTFRPGWCSWPVLTASPDGQDIIEVVVTRVSDGRLHIDVDGDGRPDHDAPIGHDLGAGGAVRSIAVVDDGAGRLRYVGPVDWDETEPVFVSPVVERVDDSWRADDGRRVSDRLVKLSAGRRHLCVVAVGGELVAYSTALSVLQQDPGSRFDP